MKFWGRAERAMNAPFQSEPSTSNSQRLDSIGAFFNTNMRVRHLPKRCDVLRSGETPQSAYMVLTGYAGRYRLMRDGRRLLTMILVPGDICDLGFVTRQQAKGTVATLTPCRIGEISGDALPDSAGWPELGAALIKRMQRIEAITEEWMLSLGRRDAIEGLAHLFCELRERLATVGLATADGYTLTISQEDMADALGVTAVHISRSLRALRNMNLITLDGGNLTIHDRPALERMAHFDPAYLRDGQD